jgi:hypothetical protein
VALSSWGGLLKAAAAAQPLVSIHRDLSGSFATAGRFHRSVKVVSAVFYYGHGDRDQLGLNAIVTKRDGPRLKARVVVAFACDAGSSLGPALVDAGASAFLGFEDILVVPLTPTAVAAMPADVVHQTLLHRGGTVRQAAEAARESWLRMSEYFRTGAGSGDVNAAVFWLAAHINARSLVYLGDGAATLI